MEIKVYTILDLKRWLYENFNNGLAPSIISYVRAEALINNPHAEDSHPALVVAFDNEITVGYTAVFPEHFVQPFSCDLYYWGTTLFVNPKYRGKGIGRLLMKAIKEAVNDRYLGLDSSNSSIAIDKKMGSIITLYERYYLSFRKTPVSFNIKYLIKRFLVYNKNKNITNGSIYKNEYLSLIDNRSYQFIQEHSENSLFVRTQEIYNWILKYQFILNTPMLNGLDSEYEFSAEAKSFNIYAIKVTHLDETVGIYFLKEHDLHFTVLNLYYNEKNKESVFQSIIDHLIHLKSLSVKTFDYDLIQYFNQIGGTSLNRKNRKENVALTTPAFFNFDKSFKIQGGDGDMFC